MKIFKKIINIYKKIEINFIYIEKYINIWKMGILYKYFGPSIYLLVLDMFIENPDKMINLREISRLVNKNPGSVTRVLSKLVKNEFLKQIKIGKVSYVYSLNIENEKVKLLIEFYKKLKEIEEKTLK